MEVTIDALMSDESRKSAEQKLDVAQANLAIAEALGAKKAEFSRHRDANTVTSDHARLIYAGEHDYVRKVFISIAEGECAVELYDSARSYNMGHPPFRQVEQSAPWNGPVYSPGEGARTIYTRVNVRAGRSVVYYHVEWTT